MTSSQREKPRTFSLLVTRSPVHGPGLGLLRPTEVSVSLVSGPPLCPRVVFCRGPSFPSTPRTICSCLMDPVVVASRVLTLETPGEPCLRYESIIFIVLVYPLDVRD